MKKYELVDLDVIRFGTDDVITTSQEDCKCIEEEQAICRCDQKDENCVCKGW